MEKMVHGIMAALTGVGFPEALEWPVQVHLRFAPAKFMVPFEQFRGEDQLRFQIWIVRDEASGMYNPAYYEACLVRPLEIAGTNDQTESVINLNQQMQLVNWSGLLDKEGVATVGDFADLQMVSEIVGNLQVLEQDAAGAAYADLLRLRYWSRTPFEAYARQGSASRSGFEVSQRFHFFSDGQGITLDEAYRFLLHRLHEKRLHTVTRPSKEPTIAKAKKSGKG